MIEYLLLLWAIQFRDVLLFDESMERIEPGLEIGAGIDCEDVPQPKRARPELRIVK